MTETHPDHAAHAQQLYDARTHTVAQIAALLPRTTVYGHLTSPVRPREPHADTGTGGAA